MPLLPANAAVSVRNKSLKVLLSKSQAGPGRLEKQEEEDFSRAIPWTSSLLVTIRKARLQPDPRLSRGALSNTWPQLSQTQPCEQISMQSCMMLLIL